MRSTSHESYKVPGCRAWSGGPFMLRSFAVTNRLRTCIADVRSVLRRIKYSTKSACRARRREHADRSDLSFRGGASQQPAEYGTLLRLSSLDDCLRRCRDGRMDGRSPWSEWRSRVAP